MYDIRSHHYLPPSMELVDRRWDKDVALNVFYKSTTLNGPKVTDPLKGLRIENNLFNNGIS